MQIHKIHAATKSGSNTNVATRKPGKEDEDACWEVAPNYPDHLLKKKQPKQQLKPTVIQPTPSPKPHKRPAQPRPPIQQQHHPATTTILHVKSQNGKDGKPVKRVVERLKVPLVTNQPPLPTTPPESSNKHVITTNKFLSKGSNAPNSKEYQHTRYADESSQATPSKDTMFDVHEAIRAAVSSFDNPPPQPHSSIVPSPSSPPRHRSPPLPSTSLPRHTQDSHIHPPSQFLPSSHLPPQYPSQFLPPQFTPQSPSRETSQHIHSRPPPPPSRSDLIDDVEFEEEILKQRALKLQEDMERLQVKKTRATFQKFEEDLRSQKQLEFEELEGNCKQSLEAKLTSLFQDKERNIHGYKLFQLELEEKMNQLLKIQYDLNHKIEGLEMSYLECAESYKRECYEVLQRERGRMEEEYARQIAEWNLPSSSSS